MSASNKGYHWETSSTNHLLAFITTDSVAQWCSPHTCSLITQRVSRGAPTITHLVAFLPERATFGQASPSSGRLAQHCGATPAENHSLGVAEHGCDAKTTLALHILRAHHKPQQVTYTSDIKFNVHHTTCFACRHTEIRWCRNCKKIVTLILPYTLTITVNHPYCRINPTTRTLPNETETLKKLKMIRKPCIKNGVFIFFSWTSYNGVNARKLE